MANEGLYDTPSFFDLSSAATDVVLFFPRGAVTNVSYSQLTLTEDPPTGTDPIFSAEWATTGVEVLYEYTFEQSGYLLKFQPMIVINKAAGAGSPTVTVRAFLRYADQRGDQPLYPSQTLTVVSAGAVNHRVIFSPGSLQQLIPQGTRLIMGFTFTNGAGGAVSIVVRSETNTSHVLMKFARIPDSGLQFIKTSRLS